MTARRLLAFVRRRGWAIHARGVRSGSPPGPADRMYFRSPES
jgi:hypothetical protein